MGIKRSIGIGMLIMVFAGVFGIVWLDVGFISALLTFGAAILFTSLVFGGIFLIFD